MKAKLETAFLANHERLFSLYYGEGGITQNQHQRLHTRNWLLLEKKLLDLGLKEDLPIDPQAPKGKRRSQEIAELLSYIPISDEEWKFTKLLDGTVVSGLKTVAEILKEVGL